MIQFLRGDANSINSSAVVPADGQPVYNKTDKLLYIGDGSTQVKNLEPIAGLNALIYNTVFETSNTSAPSSINATPQSFNRTPVLGDLALFIVSLHGFNSTYLCIYTVSNVSSNSVTCTLKSSVSITGSQGEDGADGKGILKSVKPCLLPNTWSTKTWNGYTSLSGSNIWTDGENIYYSSSNQYVLNKANSTWSAKTWNGITNIYAAYIWTDGENIYYSNGSSSTQYVLNKDTSTWTTKTWNGLTNLNGNYIWTDGENIYYSNGSTQRVLNKETSTWTTKTWNALTSFDGDNIWTDGENIYYSGSSSTQYVLNKPTSTKTLVNGKYGSGLYRHQISFFGNTIDGTVRGSFDVYDSNPNSYTMSTFYAKYRGKSFPVYLDYQSIEGDPAYYFSTAFYMSSSSHFSVYYPSTISTDGSCSMSIATTNETEGITDTVYRIL